LALKKSISGIRGTIGGKPGTALTPIDIQKFALGYGLWLKESSDKHKVVIGRDARISGPMVSSLVVASLQSIGVNVVDLGLSTTPTVEMAVPKEEAGGGIILTASHNPIEWNALKLLNHKGEFISADDGKRVLELAESQDIDFADVHNLGAHTFSDEYIDYHIQKILDLPYIDKEAIARANFKVAIDAVNSTGGIAIPRLLEKLGVEQTLELYCEPTGIFPHNPEPLKEHLTDICELIKKEGADIGLVVDPDVDRLALITEEGEMFGEEYTLVAVADYLLDIRPGAVVSNLSSSRALADLARAKGCDYYASAVGEVNVVNKMKDVEAVLGGEGNGGIILPELHYGRDSLVGIALILSHLAKSGKKLSELKSTYPEYFMSKDKVSLTDDLNVAEILDKVHELYKSNDVSREDGIKIDFENSWVHLRESNTEPIIRIYAEAKDKETLAKLVGKFRSEIEEISKD